MNQELRSASIRIGSTAPKFEARSTMGVRKLSDYRGRWLVLFSHPADFTPVCTSEILAFARLHGEFLALNCELLGLSVDSLFAHMGWIGAMEGTFGVTIPFPLLEDPSMAIAKAYGMLDPEAVDSATVRMTLIIDPDGIVRMTSTYPMTTGRSVHEVLRTVQALQVSDAHNVYTPEGWSIGDRVIDADLMLGTGPGSPDWFFRTSALGDKS